MSGEFQSHRVSEIKKRGRWVSKFPKTMLEMAFPPSLVDLLVYLSVYLWVDLLVFLWSSRFFGWATSFLNRLIDYCQSEILCFIPNFRLQRSYGIPQLFRRRQHVRYHSGRFFPWHTASLILSANLINLSFSSQFFLEFLRVIFLRQRIISEYLQK